MKKLISSRDDIEVLVRNFYKKLLPNPVVGHYFTQVVALDLEAHFPKLIDFWESVLFGQSNYRGNPMLAHFALHDKSPSKKNISTNG
ncbi:MAG: group III truncated hemoglobin [Saprospiraceae bacterium]|nr:group III truncated hemoglobin [Candidatus Vicinibacter affinis]